MIARWYAQLSQTISTLTECWQSELWDYNFGDSCSSYGGCAYTTLCTAKEPEPWFSNYEVEVWNPLVK